MRRPGLSQAETVEGAQRLTDDDVGLFTYYWQQFTEIWPHFLGLQAEVEDHTARWLAVRDAALEVGDETTATDAEARLEALDTMAEERNAVESTVAKFRTAWEQLWKYIEGAGKWFGLQGLGGPGLGIPPLLLLFGVSTLVGAISWVVKSYFDIRAGLDYDRDLLEAVEQRRITPGMAQALRGDVGGIGWAGAIGLVGVAVVALMFMGGRGR